MTMSLFLMLLYTVINWFWFGFVRIRPLSVSFDHFGAMG